MSKHRHRRLRRRAGSAGLRPLFFLAVIVAAAVLWLRPHALSDALPTARLSVRELAPVPDTAVSGTLVGGIHAYALTIDGATVLSSLRGASMYPIASTTKMMTAYLALSHLSLDDTLTVTPADVAVTEAQARIGGEEMPLVAGETLTVQQTLDALLLPSANNAAVLLAERTAGTQAAFVRLMNRTAAGIGMTHTHYADASGLSSQTQSSAIDLTRLAARALTIPAFARTVHTRTASVPMWNQVTNLNRLLWTYPGALGVKTGYTNQAGNCLVFAARRNVGGQDVTIVAALLGEPTTARMFADATTLLNDGFAAATPGEVLAAGTQVASVYPAGAHKASARLVLAAPLELAPYQRTAPLTLRVERAGKVPGRLSWRLVVRGPGGKAAGDLPLRAIAMTNG